MSGAIVDVDSSEVRPGMLGPLKAAISELVSFVEANAPREVAYNVYFDPAGTRMSVIHVHPDAASLEHHLATAGPLFSRFKDLVTLRWITVYGEPEEASLRKLRDKAALLGAKDVAVQVHHGGFLRLPPG